VTKGGPDEAAVFDRLFPKVNIDGPNYRLKDFNQTMKEAHPE
jgi:hypothetical protein